MKIAAWYPGQNEQWHGGYSTPNGLEYPSAEDVSLSSLHEVLETSNVPIRYYLSGKACQGILRRAEKRGRKLPEALERTLKNHIGRGGAHPTLYAHKSGVGLSDQEIFSQRGAYLVPSISPTVSSKRAKGSGGPAGDECQNIVMELYENHSQDSRTTGPHGIAPTISAKYGTGGGNTPIVNCIPIDMRDAIKAGNDTCGLGIGSDNDPAYTLTSGGGVQGVFASSLARRIMPVECERLQGFPDEWTRITWKGKPADQCPDSLRYKAIGNSMAVPVMRWIGVRIAKMKSQ